MLLDELKKENNSYVELLNRLGNHSHQDLGKLRISSCRNYPQYYYTPPGGQERYLTKSDLDIAKKIAQQEYKETIIKKAVPYQQKLESMIRFIENNNMEEAYTLLPPGKKALIDPIIMPFENYAEKWLAKKYTKLVYKDDTATIKNIYGESMRSKSECLISERLHLLGIPFKHDYQIRIKNGEKRYIDFVLLHKVKRTEVYYEHFGFTGDPDYVNKMLYKINEYADNNIIVGKNFFFTYELPGETLDIDRIQKIIMTNCC